MEFLRLVATAILATRSRVLQTRRVNLSRLRFVGVAAAVVTLVVLALYGHPDSEQVAVAVRRMDDREVASAVYNGMRVAGTPGLRPWCWQLASEEWDGC